MLNLIKIVLVISLASFSASASAYAYKDKGGKGDSWAGDSLKDSKEVTKKKWKKQLKKQWSTKSYKCGWLCKDDNKYKPKAGGVDKKHLLDKLKKAYAKMDDKHDFPKFKKHKGKKHDKPDDKHNVPEPGMVGLLAIGLLGMLARRRFKV